MLYSLLSGLAFSPRAAEGPCDIYAAGGTPCVAAHSMVRALYGGYAGPLYLVQRASDLATTAVPTKSPGGYADSATQDRFCAGTSCVVTRIFDQSVRGNHLNRAPWGSASKHAEKGVNATRHKLTVGGHAVYGAYFEGDMGYRCDSTWGVATGNEPESMYMVTAGMVHAWCMHGACIVYAWHMQRACRSMTRVHVVVAGDHYNGGCCFDYGNAEVDALDDGKGITAAIQPLALTLTLTLTLALTLTALTPNP